MNLLRTRPSLAVKIPLGPPTAKDILRAMQILGHKNLQCTLVYTYLANFSSDDDVCNGAKTIEEAKLPIETGFEFVTNVQGTKLFRKRK